ncbi:hypothetical protein ZWY2020_008249 [Hordeum vulgare]|nr:hypothetical protein ZWY2020_008249 [Hordeum vulgare]
MYSSLSEVSQWCKTVDYLGTSSKTSDVTSPESASRTAPSADLDAVGTNKDCGVETNGQQDLSSIGI